MALKLSSLKNASTIILVRATKNRLKVDLTKFIEEHHFTFDKVFDESVDNEAVIFDSENHI